MGAAMGMSIGGEVMGQVGQGVSSGLAFEQAKQTGAYYRALANQNAREADEALTTADLQETIYQNEAANQSKELQSQERTMEGSQIAAMAAMGIYGVTADDILKDTRNKNKLDEINLRYNADIQSWSARREGKQESWALRQQGEYNLAARRNVLLNAKLNMVATTFMKAPSNTSFLGGAGQQYQKKQPTPRTTSMYNNPQGTITGGQAGGTNTGVQTQTIGGKTQTFQTWSPYKLY